MTKKSGKKRLIGLEVDEFSLVDKPAIGETFYVTKSVEGKGDDTVKTKTKSEDTTSLVTDGTETQTAVEPAEATPAAEETTAPATEGEAATVVTPEQLQAVVDSVKSIEGRVVKAEASMKAVEKMLTDSLALHEAAAMALGEIVNLNLSALDAVMVLMQDDEDMMAGEGEGDQAKGLVQEIRDSVKAVSSEVSKAGAKISRTRMTALKEIADKLVALIASVDTTAAEKGVKQKKSIEVAKALQATLATLNSDVSKRFEDLTASCQQLEKNIEGKLEGVAKRLEEMENTAGASDAIADEDDSEQEDSSTSGTSKSVFSGLIPISDIKTRVQKREAYLKGDKNGK